MATFTSLGLGQTLQSKFVQTEQKHNKTNWQVKPSFVLDAVCFLNVLTGDSFYVEYYKDEYAHFESKLTPQTRQALANLKHKIKDENKNIISAFLALYFSVTRDKTLDDMLRTLKNDETMRLNLKKTEYYDDSDWQLFESVKDDLRTVFVFLKDIKFENYWKRNILPKINTKIAEIKKDLPKYNVIGEVEKLLGVPLASNKLTVFILNFSQPHGIRVTGLRFLTDQSYPFKIVLRNAVHETMHPSYHLQSDAKLQESLNLLRADDFLMDKIKNHNPSFGYNSFEGFIEEDSVQALEQIINEKFNIAVEAHRRWKENDDGMHVFAIALYSLMKEEKFSDEHESFNEFLSRMIGSDKLSAGKIKQYYDNFYSNSAK